MGLYLWIRYTHKYRLWSLCIDRALSPKLYLNGSVLVKSPKQQFWTYSIFHSALSWGQKGKVNKLWTVSPGHNLISSFQPSSFLLILSLRPLACLWRCQCVFVLCLPPRNPSFVRWPCQWQCTVTVHSHSGGSALKPRGKVWFTFLCESLKSAPVTDAASALHFNQSCEAARFFSGGA